MIPMEAGREMDALIAEKVIGLHVEWRSGVPMWVGKDLPGSPYVLGDGLYGHTIDNYSTEIRDAWKVLEKFNEIGLVVVVGSKRFLDTRNLVWYALIGMAKPIDEFDMNANILGEAEAPTAPLAVCRTALLAIEARNKR
jgi:hypothetical protein